MPATNTGRYPICPTPPEEFRKEFRKGTLLYNLGRFRVACWLMLVGITVYTLADIHALARTTDPLVLAILPRLIWLRAGLAASAVGTLLFIGGLKSEADIKPRHHNLDFIGPLYFTCYVACISAQAYPLRSEINPYLIFILVGASFFTMPARRALIMLLAAFASLTLCLNVFGVAWSDYRYDFVGAVVMTITCVVIAWVNCTARVSQFLQQKLIEQKNQELRETRTAAEAANQAKTEFLASMSHEIRTPMNAILGLTEITLDSNLHSEQRKWLGTAREAASHLMGLMEGILDYSRIESRAMTLEDITFDLHATVNSVARNMTRSAGAKGLSLVHHIDSDIPRNLRGDPVRVRQILVNLISNAIKFSDSGEVSLEVRPHPTRWTHEAMCVVFTVRDKGIGIPEDQREAVFDRFLQVDNSATRRFGGAGLGLATSRRLSRLMGGDITLDSRPGQGSTFTFMACFDWAPPGLNADPDEDVDVKEETCTGLVVNPIEAQARDLADRLQQICIETRTLATCSQALVEAATSSIDLIILDAEALRDEIMEAVSTLRLQHQHMAIVVCTDPLPEPDQRALVRVGADGLITKPVETGRLRAILFHILAEKRGRAEPDRDGPRYVDHNRAMRHLGLDEATYQEFLPTAVKVLQGEMALAKQAYEADDLASLARAAHSIKTSAGALGAPRLHQAADSLERTWRSGDLAETRLLFIALLKELELTLEGLRIDSASV